MKKIQLFGLLLFIAGFVSFNTLLFITQHQITKNNVGSILKVESKADLFLDNFDVSKTYSIFSLVTSINQTYQQSHEALINKYALNKDEIVSIINAPQPIDINQSLTIFDSSEIGSFKRKAFLEMGSWLNGAKDKSKEELESNINQINKNIIQYAIIPQFGFDTYQQKDISFQLAKAGATHFFHNQETIYLLFTLILSVIGALIYILPKIKTTTSGVNNNHIFNHALKNRGWLGILVGTWLIIFYIVLYFQPVYISTWVALVEPLSYFLKNQAASPFFLYGLLYTLAVLVMGIRMLIHYRHSAYHKTRTASVMFFQTAFAFLIPEILVRLNQPYFDFKNIWPLDYSFFFEYRIDTLIEQGSLGIFMLGWGIALIFVGVPVMVYLYGKRWYCSWVCGCGGLAETLGDPYRQLSDKSVKAWKAERIIIHSVLVFAIIMTIAVLYTYFTGESQLFFINSYTIREWYGAGIGATFAGVVGTGFYPIMGNRVWCRFGCPLAAYLGIIQKFKSRFRITTNGGQCISCGNCSTYCEMGIDVRWYAQRGQNIVRSSCVGCGVCSTVCPRGVLNLEVKDEEGRFGKPILIGNNHIEVLP